MMNDSLRGQSNRWLAITGCSALLAIIPFAGFVWFGYAFVEPAHPWLFTTDACPRPNVVCGQPAIYPMFSTIPWALLVFQVLRLRERLLSSE